MANTGTAAEDTRTPEQRMIDEQHGSLLASQTERLKADYENSQRGYNAQLGKSDETYQPLRNEAYVNNALAERTRKENMANMGLSGGGGTSLSLQQRNQGNLLSTLGDASRAQRAYEDDINLALANLETTYQGSVTGATADIEAQRLAAQLSQSQFDKNYTLSADQLKLAKGDAKAAQVLQLYNKKLITRDQARTYLDWSKDKGFTYFLNQHYS